MFGDKCVIPEDIQYELGKLLEEMVGVNINGNSVSNPAHYSRLAQLDRVEAKLDSLANALGYEFEEVKPGIKAVKKNKEDE